MSTQTEKAMDLAVNYLSYKSRTCFEMVTYLKKKNIEDAVIAHVMGKLREYRYVDDEIYLKNYVENNRQLTYYGTKRIYQDLRKRGISDELLLTLADLYPEDTEYRCCLLVATKNLKLLKGKTVLEKRKKIYDKLARMGYPMDMTIDVIKELDLEEEPIALSEAEIEFEEKKIREKLNCDYEKYERQHKKKGFLGRDLENRIIKSLMGRKYPYEMIRAKLDQMKED
ncbi:hypothetical protein GH810_12530 [Acetobacterium paludosum]|uniref:Regulatory protein RecX n=1 Tax=Acetobacterium paludosum TaxID=52693 RepID=A0A923HX01_9FIRM|nr:RecX family transcriptional regulator [Acetobacterium paludosum]MBC3889142.1 hypothetical protein [Acetobacterium paludosum]